MPWTAKQARYLLSKASPLSKQEQEDMQDELHADPDLIIRRNALRKAGRALRKKHAKS